jgi:hypothetical protein
MKSWWEVNVHYGIFISYLFAWMHKYMSDLSMGLDTDTYYSCHIACRRTVKIFRGARWPAVFFLLIPGKIIVTLHRVIPNSVKILTNKLGATDLKCKALYLRFTYRKIFWTYNIFFCREEFGKWGRNILNFVKARLIKSFQVPFAQATYNEWTS